ncbi:element excision factor XisH family protein [Microcystis aeruginosa]|uniref:element excision factor XisH family protein n=1 Tax=Microcystis aeruginosa TaxID=1126 RepID=UPI0023315A5B|nr:element excision factor XisH family protein [Microcystis aeruginosa]MDB9432197.1 element excision factor XisH family protein [Microcystis aeruginosa CS-552/01]
MSPTLFLKIVVEIKSFIGTSEVEDLKNALGQYVLYEKIIKRQQIEAEVSQLKEDVKDLKGRATAQIWALIVTVIGATIAASIKFGFLTKT